MVETAFRGRGWAFPVAVDKDGRIKQVGDIEAINRSIILILRTAKGERLMRPDFGSDLHGFLFKPLNEANRGRMATTVKQALNAWEPRIRVRDVTVTVSPGDPSTALIDIEYEVRSSNTKANLVYPFYVKGLAK